MQVQAVIDAQLVPLIIHHLDKASSLIFGSGLLLYSELSNFDFLLNKNVQRFLQKLLICNRVENFCLYLLCVLSTSVLLLHSTSHYC